TWDLPAGVTQIGTTANGINIRLDTPGDYVVRAVPASGNCDVLQLPFVVTGLPSAVTAIDGPLTICQGLTAVYTATGGENGTGFIWSSPGNQIEPQDALSKSVAITFSSGA